MIDLNLYYSEIDSKRFGFKISKTENFIPSFENLKNLRENDFKLIITRVNHKNYNLINDLEKNGFELKDSQLILQFILNKSPNRVSINNEFNIRKSKNEDFLILEYIARKSFKNYGHYYNNKKLNKKKVSEIYTDWTKRCLTDIKFADIVFVAELHSKPIGFLAFKNEYSNCIKKTIAILGAVDENFRNKNVFNLLVTNGINWAKNEHFDFVETNVLTTNYASLKVFTDIGFFINDSFITFHKWL